MITGSGFVKTSTVRFGAQSLTTMYISPTELQATGTATLTEVGNVSVAAVNPDPGSATSDSVMAHVIGPSSPVTAAAAVRFLEQSTFGPAPELIDQIKQQGFDAFPKSQIDAPASAYPDPSPKDIGVSKVQARFLQNAVNDSDQLRERIVFALNEIRVVSHNNGLTNPVGFTNYMRTLTNDALGNYYDVMKDVTLTPAMGHFLNMVNNDKPATGQHANENYARELMQLFTIGLTELNTDGTPRLDASGHSIPTYSQGDVMALGLALTGWTYPTEEGHRFQKHNPTLFVGPLVPFESNHDSSAKTLLGQPIAAGQSAEQELDSALTIIFNRPNVPPFVAQLVVETLVYSYARSAYVASGGVVLERQI